MTCPRYCGHLSEGLAGTSEIGKDKFTNGLANELSSSLSQPNRASSQGDLQKFAGRVQEICKAEPDVLDLSNRFCHRRVRYIVSYNLPPHRKRQDGGLFLLELITSATSSCGCRPQRRYARVGHGQDANSFSSQTLPRRDSLRT